ncbi:MAG: Rv3654c family TadE-like protein [Actinomycetota bacterium]
MGVNRRGSDDERGSVTVVMLAVIVTVLTLTVSGLLLSSAVLASHRARAAADLAALSAAGALLNGEPSAAACQSAEMVASVNHGRLQRCVAVGMEVRISVAVPAGLKGFRAATARSRAGPDRSGAATARPLEAQPP